MGQPSEGSFDPHRGHNPPLRTAALERCPLPKKQNCKIQRLLPSLPQLLSKCFHNLRLLPQAPPILFVFLIMCRFLCFLVSPAPVSHSAGQQPTCLQTPPTICASGCRHLCTVCHLHPLWCDAGLPARASWSQCSGTSCWLPKSTTEKVFPPEVLASKCDVIMVSFCLWAWDSGPCVCMLGKSSTAELHPSPPIPCLEYFCLSPKTVGPARLFWIPTEKYGEAIRFPLKYVTGCCAHVNPTPLSKPLHPVVGICLSPWWLLWARTVICARGLQGNLSSELFASALLFN